MFGMSDKEFWEDDPQLYWSYRIFYLKKMEEEKKTQVEISKYNSWLKGYTNYIGTSIALNNAFSKQREEYPTYDKMFKNDDEQIAKENKKPKNLTKQEANIMEQELFNAWARY